MLCLGAGKGNLAHSTCVRSKDWDFKQWFTGACVHEGALIGVIAIGSLLFLLWKYDRHGGTIPMLPTLSHLIHTTILTFGQGLCS